MSCAVLEFLCFLSADLCRLPFAGGRAKIRQCSPGLARGMGILDAEQQNRAEEFESSTNISRAAAAETGVIEI